MIKVADAKYLEAIEANIKRKFFGVQYCKEPPCGVVAPPAQIVIEINDELETCDPKSKAIPPGVYWVGNITVSLPGRMHYMWMHRYGTKRSEQRDYRVAIAYVSPVGDLQTLVDWREIDQLRAIPTPLPPGPRRGRPKKKR